MVYSSACWRRAAGLHRSCNGGRREGHSHRCARSPRADLLCRSEVRVIATLFVALAILTLIFIAVWILEVRRNPDTPDPGRPDAERVAVGFFANFFDALGIGSFATSTTYFRLRKLVKDELIPGTLNVGYCLPTVTQAFIGIAVIAVDPLDAGLADHHRGRRRLVGCGCGLAHAEARDSDRHGPGLAHRRRLHVREGDAADAIQRCRDAEPDGRAAGAWPCRQLLPRIIMPLGIGYYARATPWWRCSGSTRAPRSRS